jgi:hypothetical protein
VGSRGKLCLFSGVPQTIHYSGATRLGPLRKLIGCGSNRSGCFLVARLASPPSMWNSDDLTFPVIRRNQACQSGIFLKSAGVDLDETTLYELPQYPPSPVDTASTLEHVRLGLGNSGY